VNWKTFKVLYGKFIQDNVYQTLSKWTGFCGRYDKKHSVFFSVHDVVLVTDCSNGALSLQERLTCILKILYYLCFWVRYWLLCNVSVQRREVEVVVHTNPLIDQS